MRLRQMLIKEFIQFGRNPMLLRMAILMPLLQTILLSFAANMDITEVPITVWDESRTAESRDLINRLDQTTWFNVVDQVTEQSDWSTDLDRGDAIAALHFPPTFAADLIRHTATLQILVDGSDSATAGVASGYLTQIATDFDRELLVEQMDSLGQRVALPSVQIQTRVFYNPDLRSLWFMAPGVLALALGVLLQNMTALSIARERELGTLEQLVMTPIRPVELMLGKLVPYGLVGCLDAVVITGVIVGILHVPLRGSIPALALATVFYIVATLGVGLVVSTISANQQQAQLTNFFLSMPSIILSGFIFPVENLPLALRAVSRLVPMTYYVDLIRGVFLRGAGFAPMVHNLVWLAVLMVGYILRGARNFHKRLD